MYGSSRLSHPPLLVYYCQVPYTVKPANVVTSIKQSPVLKGHLFVVLS